MKKIAKKNKKKLLFLITEDWYFCSHRLSLATAAKSIGYDVVVVTRVNKHGPIIEAAGLKLIQLNKLKRSSLNPLIELAALLEIIAIYKNEKPDIVHHVAIKPVIYGSIAAKFIGLGCKVNAMGGLGFIFNSTKLQAKLLKILISPFFRFLLNDPHGRVILQNTSDINLLKNFANVNSKYIRLIAGAGVDLKKYNVQPLLNDIPLITLISRMLWDKGIREFVEAAKALKAQGINARFVIIGNPDPENPLSSPQNQLTAWDNEGFVEWWGYRSDIPNILAQSYLICLPTYYGEGVPKVLLESMASGRAIITTDIPGCRELVEEGGGGILIKPKNIKSLSRSIEMLLNDRSMCKSLGKAGREFVELKHSTKYISNLTFNIYKELLADT